jgi:phosphopantetheine--protein transferase-like protein
MSVVDAPFALFAELGVDVVSLERMAKLLEHGLLDRLCAAGERAHLDDAVAADPGVGLDVVAATWAIKEAAVKVAGGRPPQFGWHDIEVRHASSDDPAPPLLAAALPSAGSNCPRRATFRWLTGACASGTAAWRTADGRVFAVASGQTDYGDPSEVRE